MEDLKEQIHGIIDDWKYSKTSGIEISSDADFEIFKEMQRCEKFIFDYLEELDATIDSIIEEDNEPSLYECDLREDNRARYMDLVR